MIVIALHPTEELRLRKLQKELIRCLFEPDALIYAHQCLWIKTDFKSVEQAKNEIKNVTILAPEYDEDAGCVVCPVTIQTLKGNEFESRLKLIEGLPRRATPDNNGDIFPINLKIFRLGECTSPSPNVYELSSTVWKKLT